MKMLVAGDVGATKTTLGLFDPENGPRSPRAQVTLESGRYDSLETLCRAFLADVRVPVHRASFGVPGPVVNGRVRTTNLPWEIDERRLSRALDLEGVTLFNDLVAGTYGAPHLEPDELQILHAGTHEPGGPIAVVAPGTGLGEAFATVEGGRYTAHPSEGGHVDFAPTTMLQAELLAYLRRSYEHVSYERVCSGMGIPNLYDFLRERGEPKESEWVAAELIEAEDRTPVIFRAAQDAERPCALCRKTLELFVQILGAKAGNLALTTLATGGVYIGGGIPLRILNLMTDGTFTRAFLDKGRLRPIMEAMSVYVILNSEVALFGAACHGLSELRLEVSRATPTEVPHERPETP